MKTANSCVLESPQTRYEQNNLRIGLSLILKKAMAYFSQESIVSFSKGKDKYRESRISTHLLRDMGVMDYHQRQSQDLPELQRHYF